MAYVLGYLYADGSLEDASYIRGKYIRVTSVEKQNILKIRRCLNSEHTVVKLKPTRPNGKYRYLLRIGSHKLYSSLTKLGMYPNKSLTIKFPDTPKKYLNDFVRGYFDGDGCVYLYLKRGKRQKMIIKKLSVIFTSGSEIFLEELKGLLHDIAGIKHDKVYNSQRAFQLRYSTGDSIRIFKFIYGGVRPKLFLRRKLKVFLRYFKMRLLPVDR